VCAAPLLLVSCLALALLPVGGESMATAIDFAALMAEEKRRMLRSGDNAADGATLKNSPAEVHASSWQDCADRPVRLVPGRRPKLELAHYEAAAGDELKVGTPRAGGRNAGMCKHT